MQIKTSYNPARRAMICVLALAGCTDTASTAPGARDVSATDLAFVTNLYNVIDFDREVIGELLPRNPDPRVAALAHQFLTQGDSLEAQVRPIAAREGILPPAGQRFVQSADLQSRIASVLGNRPIDIDQEFIADELYSHEQALQTARTRAQQPGANAELLAISKEGIGILENDIAQLKTLQGELPNNPR